MLRKICGRAVQLPIQNRWYTVEAFLWSVLFYHLMSLSPRLFEENKIIHFWPGDNFRAIIYITFVLAAINNAYRVNDY